MPDANDSSNVGYGKPPKHTQFKPGKSGNPKGRPRKITTFEDDVETELRSTVIVLEDGKRRKITKRRAIAKRIVSKALSGDARSTELLFEARQQSHSDQPDKVQLLTEEFRSMNRLLTANEPREGGASIESANSPSLISPEGDKS